MKVSEKFVFFFEVFVDDDVSDDEMVVRWVLILCGEDENRLFKDEELDVLRKRGGICGKSYVEWLFKM